MLYVIIGTDSKAISAARHKIWRGAFEEIDPVHVSAEEFAALGATDSLFGGSKAYRLQNVLSAKEEQALGAESVLDMAEDLAASPHTFIFEEEKVLAKPLAALKKAGAEIIELERKEKKEPFNVFALANALGKRDRKNLWLGLMRAQSEGVAPENIAGILAWKARAMLSVARSESEKKSLTKLSRDLVVMYHDSHRGAGDLALLLERFALTL